jgi:hypothetical protein
MAPLLDDDEETTTGADDSETKPRQGTTAPDAMFDDAETASAADDVEEAANVRTEDND